ncbi:hypothetical protein GCM10010305_21960 [Streptomyces termitum]|uniref:Transposase n=1 Tax=Streptomyces termitum TaxID=67368 RepID=A0A918SY20_9ACTN|nr:hypothetical protein GCM10010305_21960 [Streptomyces termitum]
MRTGLIREAVEALAGLGPSLAGAIRTVREKDVRHPRRSGPRCRADKAYQGAGSPVRVARLNAAPVTRPLAAVGTSPAGRWAILPLAAVGRLLGAIRSVPGRLSA